MEGAEDSKQTKEIKEGEGFGEVALLYNAERTATIRCLTDTEVWCLDGQIFKKIIIKSSVDRRSTELGFLEKVDLLNKLDKFEKLKLIDGLKAQWFRSGDIVVREGDIGDLFYIVEEGHVECLHKVNKSGK